MKTIHEENISYLLQRPNFHNRNSSLNVSIENCMYNWWRSSPARQNTRMHIQYPTLNKTNYIRFSYIIIYKIKQQQNATKNYVKQI